MEAKISSQVDIETSESRIMSRRLKQWQYEKRELAVIKV